MIYMVLGMAIGVLMPSQSAITPSLMTARTRYTCCACMNRDAARMIVCLSERLRMASLAKVEIGRPKGPIVMSAYNSRVFPFSPFLKWNAVE